MMDPPKVVVVVGMPNEVEVLLVELDEVVLLLIKVVETIVVVLDVVVVGFTVVLTTVVVVVEEGHGGQMVVLVHGHCPQAIEAKSSTATKGFISFIYDILDSSYFLQSLDRESPL